MEPLSSEMKKAIARNFPGSKGREEFRALLKRNHAFMDKMVRDSKRRGEIEDFEEREKFKEKAMPVVHELWRRKEITGGSTTINYSHSTHE